MQGTKLQRQSLLNCDHGQSPLAGAPESLAWVGGLVGMTDELLIG